MFMWEHFQLTWRRLACILDFAGTGIYRSPAIEQLQASRRLTALFNQVRIN